MGKTPLREIMLIGMIALRLHVAIACFHDVHVTYLIEYFGTVAEHPT